MIPENIIMKKAVAILWLMGLGVFIIQCQVDSSGEANRELTITEKHLVQAGNNFGYSLFQKVNESEPGNLFISPLSVSLALGMTLNGGRGETFDAMRSALGWNELTQDEINRSYRSLIHLMTGLDKRVDFEIANSIWFRNELNVRNDFIETNQNYFDAEVTRMDFNNPASVQRINKWVSDKTHKKIQSIVEELDPSLVMLLINAVYFKATWMYEFDKNKTYDGIFTKSDGTTTSCRMMRQTGSFRFLHKSGYDAVDLPYGDGNFSMTILLPHTAGGMNDLIATLDQNAMVSIAGQFEEVSGTVEIPKFKMELKYTLNDVLQTLGMNIAFIPDAADFSGIDSLNGKHLFISDVKHKTFVEVNEEGTEAAAVTSVGIGLTSVGGGGFLFKADRPFIFLIRENRSQTVLFIGKIASPLGLFDYKY